MNKQVVGLQGVNFVNKGAELMMRAIIQNLEDKDIPLGVDLRCGTFKQRTDLGLNHLPWLLFAKFPTGVSKLLLQSLSIAFSAVPKPLRKSNHLLRNSDVTTILDASGFLYSDQIGRIGKAVTYIAATNIKKWKKEGKKIILLPQAFGPFKDPQMRSYVTQIVENADLVFARDNTSLQHLSDLPVSKQNIKSAPDFTSLMRGTCPETYKAYKNRPCLIPNVRMVDKTPADVAGSYAAFVTKTLTCMTDKGLDPFILINEEFDKAFSAEINRSLAKPVEIVSDQNPLYLKGIIGQCSFVVSSRYHGLINALSQGVPILATSWSHKYQSLLEDYDCKECLISVPPSDDEIQTKIDYVSADATRFDLLTRLQKAGADQRRMVLDMWDEVYKVMGI